MAKNIWSFVLVAQDDGSLVHVVVRLSDGLTVRTLAVEVSAADLSPAAWSCGVAPEADIF